VNRARLYSEVLPVSRMRLGQADLPVEAAIRDTDNILTVNMKGVGSFADAARDGLSPGHPYATHIEMGMIARSVVHGGRSWDSERFQRCRSRARTAAAIDVIRFGLHRDRRKMRQDFSRATPRPAGARAADSARLTVCWVGVSSRPGGRLRGVVTHEPAPM
jgi:hypothetical protein